MISTIICDLDGLLADTEALHFQAYQEALEDHGARVDLPDYIEYWIRRGEGVNAWAAEQGLTLDIPAIRAQKYARYQELVHQSVRAMPGARDALQRVRGTWRLALASASHGNAAQRVLECLGLAHYFDDILSGDDVERAKPFPDIFLKSAHNMRVKPDECVVLEDAERGVRAAFSAGMRCIAVPNQYTRGQDFSLATRVVSSLDDVTTELLNALSNV